MKYDEKISGPHDRRVHFGFGLFFGAVVGAAVSLKTFETMPSFIIGTAGVALVTAFCCARWGDPAWHWLIARLHWFS